MKIRFPSERRAGWRQHFLAIARQVESAAECRQEFSSTTGLRRPRVQGGGFSRRVRAEVAVR
jgi:hypothetical protein